jgi:hypothetical protein
MAIMAWEMSERSEFFQARQQREASTRTILRASFFLFVTYRCGNPAQQWFFFMEPALSKTATVQTKGRHKKEKEHTCFA